MNENNIMPGISVIVPTFNNERTIERCLSAIKRSSYSDHELIVSDCGSDDQTVRIAKRYADKVLDVVEKPSRREARIAGLEASTGEIIVNVDSDVIIKEDSLSIIAEYLSAHPNVAAVTGLLSKEHPYKNIFSQYKNLYMNYIFSKLPERVSFLYGSIYAVRKRDMEAFIPEFRLGEDTALGQHLFSKGKEIAFLRNLEVVHLKKYDMASFVKNDFLIPFYWAQIFLKNRGWKQLGRNKTGYAHSPKEQLMSVMLLPIIALLCIIGILTGSFSYLMAFALVIWGILNYNFFFFLAKEKGLRFLIIAFFITLLDNLVMAFGILCGFAAYLLNARRN